MQKFGDMSKIGKKPISIPETVKVEIDNKVVKVSGSLGVWEKSVPRQVTVKVSEGLVVLSIKKPDIKSKQLFGTWRSLLANAVKGVSEGWTKTLELVGTGYRAEVQGDSLILTVGYSHPVKISAPSGIKFNVVKTEIYVTGFDREVVGEVAAKIRAVRPPEPYKGKGIRYSDEVVRKKPGKAAKTEGGVQS